jgi:hypothetical protein
VGLSDVDNTSDLNKPVSTATQTALNGKADSIHTHLDATGSVAGFMSASDKTKLDGIASGATANTGTVTSVVGGTGLSGGTITTSGTLAVSYGTAAGTACEGNDGRLSDNRTPTSHTHGNISNAGAIGTTANLPVITTTSGVLTTGVFGTGANEFCQGNDGRLSDNRAPTAHTHALKDSYVGVIESPVNSKVYTIDTYTTTARTITGIRTRTDSGTATITVKRENSGDSSFENVASGITVSSSLTNTTSLSNAAVVAGKRIQIEITAVSTPVHLAFVIEYDDVTGAIS